MSKIQAVIIEDERPTARLLHAMVTSLRPEWEVTILPGTVWGAVRWFAENEQPDIIFLDIHLLDGTAFDILEQAAPKGLIVFTTAFDEYAVQAFSVNGIDYLLKPVMQERLADAIAKFERLSPQQIDVQNQTILEVLRSQITPAPSYRSRFLIFKGAEMLVVHIVDVAFFYTQDKTVFAMTFNNQRHALTMRLESLMEELDSKIFFRTNRQTIVNIHAITKIEPYFHNSVVIYTTPQFEEKITVSKEKMTSFKLWLNN